MGESESETGGRMVLSLRRARQRNQGVACGKVPGDRPRFVVLSRFDPRVREKVRVQVDG